MAHSPTRETPFRLVYETEAAIPVEIEEPSRQTEAPPYEEMNDIALREEVDLIEEIRMGAALREASLKQKIAMCYNAKFIRREFEVDNLVLKRNRKESHKGMLSANWEGPYRIYAKTGTRVYYLENLQGE